MINQAIILCAGFGKRMMPLTADRPKPLVTVNGVSILASIITHLRSAGVTDIVVNGHAHLDVLHGALKAYPDITLSAEAEILDTGGGIQTALPLLPDPGGPCLVINGDAYWTGADTLPSLIHRWDADRMDLLLALQPVGRMPLTTPIGDYTIESETGRAIRTPDQSGTHMFTGIRILHPRVMTRPAHTPFSFLEVMDSCEKAGRLFALENPGDWHHLSTPADIESVERAFA